jgi:hypothetical protein
MRKLIYFLLTIFLLAGAEEAYAQISRKSVKKNNKRLSSYRGKKSGFGKEKVYNTLGFSLNALNYYGDLAPKPNSFSTDIAYTRPGFGIHYGHRFGPRYTLTANFMYGTLRGSDAESADKNDESNGMFRYYRNLSFRNRIKELSVVANIDLFENQATYISRVAWTPYLYGGLAVFHHNPKAQVPKTDLHGNALPNAGEWVELQPLGTEGQFAKLRPEDNNYGIKPYKRIQAAIPIGVGARFRINQLLDFSAEIGFRYLFTDYIDDVSRYYVDLNLLDSELARAMSYRSNEVSRPEDLQPEIIGGQTYLLRPGYGKEHPDNVRGNSSDKDIYMVTSVKLTYILGKTFHRAKFR